MPTKYLLRKLRLKQPSCNGVQRLLEAQEPLFSIPGAKKNRILPVSSSLCFMEDKDTCTTKKTKTHLVWHTNENYSLKRYQVSDDS